MTKQNYLTSFSFLFLALFMWGTLQNVAYSQQIKNNTIVDEVTYIHFYPEKLAADIPLSNPGIGIEQASLLESRTGKTQPSYSGAVGPKNNSLNEVSTVRYIRSDWVSLAPEKNEYHWTTLDNNINDAWSKGQQIGFSINCASPVLSTNYWQNVPAWYINDARHVQCNGSNSPSGCTYYKVNFTNCGSMGTGADCTDNWVVNHDDPVYIQTQLDLIEAIRLRYDNKQWAVKWAYLDMRNWGVWGEWQTDEAKITGTSTYWPEPSLENKKAIIDAFLKFEYIPVIANFKDEESWVYAMEKGAELGKTVGWRTDGIDVTAWKINPAIEKYTAIKDGWKIGPIYGEVMGSSLTSEQITTTVLPRAYLWHMSGFNNKWEGKYSSDATYKSLIDEFRAKGGYRLAVDEVVVPGSIQQNKDFSVIVKLINSGISPLYRKYYTLSVKLSPVNGSDEKVINFSQDITKVYPGDTISFVAENQKIAETGDYKVYVGITSDETFNPAPLPVTLANTESTTNGNVHWCYVGEMNVTLATSINGINSPSGWNSNLKGEITIYSMQGKIVDIVSSNSSITEWMNSNNLPIGTYLIRSAEYSQLINVVR
jgi:hypothetical protein